MTVVVPTLAADLLYERCLLALSRQTYSPLEIIVVDNSGHDRVRQSPLAGNPEIRVLVNATNVGFGQAVNQGIAAGRGELVATLNDDAEPVPVWLERLVERMQSDPAMGICASKVLLDEKTMDSAGMLAARDGTTKQRGHREHPDGYQNGCPVLFASGSAALYRRAMLDQIGTFASDFFLYCEDSDLGLRAQRAGWKCYFEPEAVVAHAYSHSAGRASRLKAYYVERNRLRLVVRNFPLARIPAALAGAWARYAWHLLYGLQGKGTAAAFQESGGTFWELPYYVLRAHGSLVANLPALAWQRHELRRTWRLSDREFWDLLQTHSISLRGVAAL